MICLDCGADVEAHLASWLERCPRCGLLASKLADPAYNGSATRGWDAATAAAMTPLRERDAQDLCTRLATAGLLGGQRLLDVGCGPGWFLRAAAERGLTASGIEPDAAVAAAGRASGLDIQVGLFPAVRPAGVVDIVTMNDVFEHLPEPPAALAAVHALLPPGGLLVLNLPSSRGIFYRVASLLARLGLPWALERLWQKGFESPHLFYFAPANLTRVVERSGFTLVHQFALAAVTSAGLFGRIRAGGRLARLPAALLYVGIRLGLPLIELLPSDIMVLVFRRK